ncbi:MAG: hypothetical protein LCH91_01860 [Bacteroidetes bacterium]|nr:hypothetical protein [Bacteroidota bacterium]
MDDLSGNEKILKAKAELDETLKTFIPNYKTCNWDKECLSQLIGQVSTNHTKVLNIVNQVLAELHEEYDFFENKNLQYDYVGTVENFIPTSLKIVDGINSIAKINGLSGIKVSPKSYVTIQRFVNTFSNKATIEQLKKTFEDKNISTSGFNQKFHKTMKAKFIKLQIWLGVPLLLLCGATILFGENVIGSNFNGIQLIFLKAFMALTISIVASSLIEGNATVKWTLQKGLAIRAVGWVAVFLLLYFLNPAPPSEVY